MKIAVAALISDLRERGSLNGIDVANITAVSPATVSHWSAGTSFPQPKTELMISGLRYAVDRLSELFDPEETRRWLYAKHRLFDDACAIDLIHDGRTDEVLGVIERLSDGTYS